MGFQNKTKQGAIVLAQPGRNKIQAVEVGARGPGWAIPKPSLCLGGRLCMDIAAGLLHPRRTPFTLDLHRPEERTRGWRQEPRALVSSLYLCFLFCGSAPAQFALSLLLPQYNDYSSPTRQGPVICFNFSIGRIILHKLLLYHIIVGYFPLLGGKPHQGRKVTPGH